MKRRQVIIELRLTRDNWGDPVLVNDKTGQIFRFPKKESKNLRWPGSGRDIEFTKETV